MVYVRHDYGSGKMKIYLSEVVNLDNGDSFIFVNATLEGAREKVSKHLLKLDGWDSDNDWSGLEFLQACRAKKWAKAIEIAKHIGFFCISIKKQELGK